MKLLLAMLGVLVLLAGWLAVQRAARHFAIRNPKYDAAREEGTGCGGCGCGPGRCERDEHGGNGV
jgi:hypothetical protein